MQVAICNYCGGSNSKVDLNLATARVSELESKVDDILEKEKLTTRHIYFACNHCEAFLEFSYKDIHDIFGNQNKNKFMIEY